MIGSNSTSLLTNSISGSLLIPNGTHKKSSSSSSHFTLRFRNQTSLSSPPQFEITHFNFPSLLIKRCNLFCVHAARNKPRNGNTASLAEISEFDDELDAIDDDFVDDDDDDDEGFFLPFGKMQKWLQNKPRGFGEGKVYDTSMEDKLLEEIEQSRKAQAANLENLKNNPFKPVTKKDNPINKKVPEAEVSGIRVRVGNLPKKKNIHRDLRLAFKEVHGVVNIIPAVSGNKNTKDPICKGFAFIDFKSEEDVDRFLRQFSGQNVAFGRIQKRIKCMIANSHSSNTSDDESAGSFFSDSNLTIPALQEDTNANFDVNRSSYIEISSDVPGDADELTTENLQAVTDNLESFSMSELNGDSMEPMKLKNNSFSQKKQEKRRAAKKKIATKVAAEKVPKLEIPGSAKRLKIKEKAVLTEVFGKYGSQIQSVLGSSK